MNRVSDEIANIFFTQKFLNEKEIVTEITDLVDDEYCIVYLRESDKPCQILYSDRNKNQEYRNLLCDESYVSSVILPQLTDKTLCLIMGENRKFIDCYINKFKDSYILSCNLYYKKYPPYSYSPESLNNLKILRAINN